mmetsp:Transcript_5710/g.8096  ORF Transcript_5710/g.8096 Transcript_5710/m.8096 type:complete len:456 (+) Transcript_5710:95-1462(+)
MRVFLTAPLLILFAASTANGFGIAEQKRVNSAVYRLEKSSTKLYSTAEQEKTQAVSFSSFSDSLEDNDVAESSTASFPLEKNEAEESGWQSKLDQVLDPATSMAKRQTLLSELLSANDEIRESVQAAVRDQKIDPLLTPKQRKLQEGTQAVARQITNDILPGIAATAASPRPPADLPTLVPKVGSKILSAISNQARRNLELLQGDLRDPSRIPQRLQEQTSSLANEAANIWRDTPENLDGPPYKVISVGEGYEIREYEGYSVASTNVARVGEKFSMDDVASSGAAFNALAAYLFGANEDGKSMEMTTPVTTTSTGVMRFYLKEEKDNIPQPVSTSKDERRNRSKSKSNNGGDEEMMNEDVLYDKAGVQIQNIPPTRLAVARFTGFVTEGEIQRQKDVLLSHLQLDGIELDVPHGSIVPYLIFQYNPPYTIPIVRRNEIAVPVRIGDDAPDPKTEW